MGPASGRGDDLPPLLTQPAVELYERLVAFGPVPWDEVTGGDEVALKLLEDAGLARRTSLGVEALSPFAPMNGLIRAALDRVTRTHETAASLERAWQRRPERADAVEIVRGAASAAAWDQLFEQADSLAVLNRWPIRRPVKVVPAQYDLLAKGGTISTIYDTAVLSDPEALEATRLSVEAGERARVFPGVPVNMYVSPASAIVSLPGGIGSTRDRLVVHAPRVLEVLWAVFDALWARAIPISGQGDATAGREQDGRILALLAAGLTDSAIGRELGVSERTVRRRISSMQAQLGAQTRFQLGVRAAREGLITDR